MAQRQKTKPKNWYGKYTAAIIFIAMVLVSFSSFYKNTFHISPPVFFQQFGSDNEDNLVLGRVLADKFDIPMATFGMTLLMLPQVRTPNLQTADKSPPAKDIVRTDSPGNFWAMDSWHGLAFNILQNNNKMDDIVLLGNNINIINQALDIIAISVNKIKVDDNHYWMSSGDNRYDFHYGYDSLPVAKKYITNYSGRNLSIGQYKTMVYYIDNNDPAKTVIVTSLPRAAIDKINKYRFSVIISGQPITAIDIKKNIRFEPYQSSVGWEAYAVSSLYKYLGNNLKHVQKVEAMLSAITLIILVFLYYRGAIFPKGFAVMFFLTLFLSPMFTAMAHNLYFAPFSFFLPAIFALCYITAQSVRAQWSWLLLTYAAFVIRFGGMQYDFTPSIILLAMAPALYQFFVAKNKIQRRQACKQFFMIWLMGVLGFISVMLWQANLRADGNLWQGLLFIFQDEIARRVYPVVHFNNIAEYDASAKASYLSVLKIYFFHWWQDIIVGIHGRWFPWLFCWSLLTVVASYFLSPLKSRKDIYTGLFFAFLSIPLAWYILAKPHAYIHTHYCFILWSLGFVAAMFTIIIDAIRHYFNLNISLSFSIAKKKYHLQFAINNHKNLK